MLGSLIKGIDTEKIILDRKEMSQNMNDTEIEYSLVEHPPNIHRFASTEITVRF